MAMTEALSIYLENGTTKAYLKNKQVGIIENLQKTTLSARLKSKNANLSQAAGSYEFKRFANATVNDYGTARAAGKGSVMKAPPVVVNMNINKEIVEEVNFFDANGSFTEASFQEIVNQRANNYSLVFDDWNDVQFFATAKAGGTKGADISSAKKAKDEVEAVIQKLEMTGKGGDENAFVKGVDRKYMAMVCSPKLYGMIKNELNDCYNFSGTAADELVKGLNGVAIYSSVNLPEGVDYVLLTQDSIAQPVIVNDFGAERIPLSIDYALGLYWRAGSKVLAPELVYYGAVTA